MPDANGFANGVRSGRLVAVIVALGLAVSVVWDLDGCQRPADDERGERVRDLAVGLQVSLDVLPQGEGHVRMTDPGTERLPVDLRIAAVYFSLGARDEAENLLGIRLPGPGVFLSAYSGRVVCAGRRRSRESGQAAWWL
jgi:hypothetical protein